MATNKKLFTLRRSCLFIAAVAALLTGCGPPGPRALLAGKRLVEQKRYEEAVARLSVAAQLMATNAPAWNYLGIALQHAGHAEKAAQAYDRALKLNHDFLVVHYNLGCLLLEQNQVERARNELTAFTLREPRSADGWLRLGSAQLRGRDLAGADKSCREALRLNPESPEALNNLGLVQWQLGRQRDAITFFNNALAKKPDYPAALLNLAIVSQGSNSTRRFALEKYKQYLASNPRPANWDAVNAIARQLELELNPPRPSASVQPAAVTAPNTARPVTNNPVRTVAAATNLEKPIVAAESPKTPALRPAGPVTDPGPAIKPEVVQLPEATPVKVAENVGTPKPLPSPVKAAPVTVAPPVAPRTLPPGTRYQYTNPTMPASGNRADAERLLAQGASAQRDRRLKEAAGFYQAAAQADPAFFDAQTSLASVSADLDDMAQSLFAFETALAINPASFPARFNFAKALAKANYPQDSAQELERLLAAQSSETPARLATAHLTLANLYADRFHRPEFARPHYLKVLELDPQNSQATAIRYWLNENP